MKTIDEIIEDARWLGWDPNWLHNSLWPAIRAAGGSVIDGHPVPYSMTVSIGSETRYVYQDGRVERAEK